MQSLKDTLLTGNGTNVSGISNNRITSKYQAVSYDWAGT